MTVTTVALLGGVVVLAVLETLHVIPSAPLFSYVPLHDGVLALSYVLTLSAATFVMLIAVVPLVAFIVSEFNERGARLAQANDIISRYVASQLAQQILAGNRDVLERHERRKLTLFFSDVKDFAEIADHVEPEDLSEVLNEYLSAMASIGERYGGTIDKFVGDAVMIFFGAPVQTSDHDQALRAVRMAIEMQETMGTLGEKWRRDGFDRRFVIRIGINTGRATIGSFGSKRRVDYTAIGRQVNLAARLQTNCEPGKILLSHSTWVLVQEAVECVEKGEINVKGFQNPVRVYEVVGLRSGVEGAETAVDRRALATRKP
jgi:class 3 adenylate cyclase